MSLSHYLCCLAIGFYKSNFKSGIGHCYLQLRGLLVSSIRLIGLQLLLTIVIYNVCAELTLKCSSIINRFCEQKLKRSKNCLFSFNTCIVHLCWSTYIANIWFSISILYCNLWIQSYEWQLNTICIDIWPIISLLIHVFIPKPKWG